MTTESNKLKQEISNAKAGIALRDHFNKLRKNKSFKEVIEKAYFEEESQRLVIQKSAPGMASPEAQEQIVKDIDAIGGLYQFFSAIMAHGQTCENELASKEELMAKIDEDDLGE